MYFERWGLLLSKGDFYGVFNVLNVPTTCVLNTLSTTQQRGVHDVALSPQAEQRYTLETLKTILPVPTSDNHLLHRLESEISKDMCLCFPTWILYLNGARHAAIGIQACKRTRTCLACFMHPPTHPVLSKMSYFLRKMSDLSLGMQVIIVYAYDGFKSTAFS